MTDRVFVIDGQRYVQIGDRAVPIDEHGRVNVQAEERPNENGGQDVVIHVPCLTISTGAD